MSIDIGQPAPDFTLPGQGQGNEVTLSGFKGQKNVVLAFYVLAFTGGWSMELQGFQSSLKEFEAADTQVLGISVDTAPSAGAFAKTAGVTFPLLSDWPRYEVSRLYGTFREDRNVSQRVTFVIDKQGTVRGRTEEPRNMELHSQEALRIVKELAGKG